MPQKALKKTTTRKSQTTVSKTDIATATIRNPTKVTAAKAAPAVSPPRKDKKATPRTPKRSQPAGDNGEKLVVLSYEQIADRARRIWEAKGCQHGQDEQNWLAAEAELRKELSA